MSRALDVFIVGNNFFGSDPKTGYVDVLLLLGVAFIAFLFYENWSFSKFYFFLKIFVYFI